MWEFRHRLTTHSYETVLRILTDILMDPINQEFERKLKLEGGGGGFLPQPFHLYLSYFKQ
jgi:hypothetical protein